MVNIIPRDTRLASKIWATARKDEPHLVISTDCSTPYVLMGFLELYRKTHNVMFLKMASRIGDNILTERFYRGFFVPSKKVIYTKFDYVEPLALLRLDEVFSVKSSLTPEVWPSRTFFVSRYGGFGEREDTFVIYSRTKLPVRSF